MKRLSVLSHTHQMICCLQDVIPHLDKQTNLYKEDNLVSVKAQYNKSEGVAVFRWVLVKDKVEYNKWGFY